VLDESDMEDESAEESEGASSGYDCRFIHDFVTLTC